MTTFSRRSFMNASACGATGGLLSAAAGSADNIQDRPVEPETFQLTREIPVEKGYDLVVAGGGPAGVAAAICAARLGARVLLVEATGSLGGMGTNGYVSRWSSLGNGDSLLVGGLILELIEGLCQTGRVVPNPLKRIRERQSVFSIAFGPESLKCMLDKLCREAGVEVRFFTRVIDAEQLVLTLRNAGAHLPQPHTSKTMTRPS